MNKQANGDMLFTRQEVKSLSKLISACSDAISSLVSDGDFLGWDNYRALQMWDEVLQGHEDYDLSNFVERDEEGDEQEEDSPKTILEWLAAYGSRKRTERY